MCKILIISFIWLSLLLPACASDSTPDIPQGRSNNQSPEAATIQRIWQERVEQSRATLRASGKINKGLVGKEFEILEKLLDSAPHNVVSSELERIVHSTTTFSQMSPYEQRFIEFHITKYRDENRQADLVEILSNKCPRYIGYAPLELALTNGKKPENLIFLFGAYQKTSNQEIKQQILRIFERIFSMTLKKRASDDSEFLKASEQWLLANQSNLKINTAYSPDSLIPESRKFFLP